MDNSYSRYSKSQTVSRHASTHEIKSSLKDIQNEYAKALDQIQDLKSEKAHLRATLNHSLDEKSFKQQKEESGFIDQFSQSFKSTYAKKAFLDAEKRVIELEEENKELKKLIRRNGKKFVKLQEEILAYQYQADKLGHLKLYNKNLQSEMELLDHEFQTIVKRIDYLGDEKSQSQINQSLSIRNNKDFGENLTKYINYIVKTIGSLDPKHFIRFRFEETFPSGSTLSSLIEGRDYSTLLLKSLKLVADILPNNMDQDVSLQGLSPFSVDITPQKISPFQTINEPLWSQIADVSPQSSLLLHNSLARGMSQSNKDGGSALIRSQMKQPTNQPDQNLNNSTKKQRETQSSLSFGTRESKPHSIDLKGVETPQSIRSQHESMQKLDISPTDRPTYNFPDVRTPTMNAGNGLGVNDDFENKTAAELELMQREKELIEREKELIEKKKEYLMRSRELNERDFSMSEQRSVREKEGKSLNDSSVEHGRIRSQKRLPTEIEKSRDDEYEQRRTPVQLKSILKSSSSQMIADLDKEKDYIKIRNNEDNSSIMSVSQHVRNAKDISTVLREKSKHLAKVLNKENSYENDLHSISKSEHDLSIQKDATMTRSRERSPVNSHKNFDDESLKATKGRSSDKILHEDYESHVPSNDTSFATDKRSWFYPRSANNQSKNNSHLGSLADQNRRESNESRKDETMNKKVSFYGQNRRTLEDQDSIVESQYYSQQVAQSPGQEQGDMSLQDRQQIVTFDPIRRFSDNNSNKKGTQYASFTVSFGRTESAERDPTSPVKYLASIMDVATRKRVDHLHQTYDVVKGEETYKRAVRDGGSPQYRVTSESQLSSRRAKRYHNSEDYMALQTKSMVQQKEV